METLYALWRAFLDKFLSYAAAVLLLGGTLVALAEVIRRYLFGVSFYWAQDAVTLFILAGVFLYLGVAQARRAHLAVTVALTSLQSMGPTGVKIARVMRAFALLATLLFVFGLAVWGLEAANASRVIGRRAESQYLVLWPFLYALVAGFLIMAVTLAFQLYYAVQTLRGRRVFPQDEEGPQF